VPENTLSKENTDNTWCHPIDDNRYFYGLQEFIREQGVPLLVHEIFNPDNFPPGTVPPENDNIVVYDNVTFDNYKTNIRLCHDVLLQLHFRNSGYESTPSGTEALDHIVTGVSYYDGGPGNRVIEISDPWTPSPAGPGPDHNNDENRFTYENMLVVNEDPLIVRYTGWDGGLPVVQDVQVVKLIFISPENVPENFTLHLLAGWNLIGFPVTNADMTPAKLFAGITYTIGYWVAPFGPYKAPDKNKPVEDNRGYWVNVNENTTITFSGVRQSSRTMYFVAGWNLVSFPLTSENTTPNKLFADTTFTIGYWAAPFGPYKAPDKNKPVEDNRGYWVKENQDKTVTVPL